jgi:hypothetical protein
VSTGGGLLDRPDDRPSEAEEAAISKMTWKQRRALTQTLFSLKNSAERALRYVQAVNFEDYAMERRVQDRLLGQLLELKPSIKQMPLEEAIARSRGTARG